MAEGLGAQAQITLDISGDMQHLQQLQGIMQMPLGQDTAVRKELTLATAAISVLITTKLKKQNDLVGSADVVGGLTKLMRDAGGAGS